LFGCVSIFTIARGLIFIPHANNNPSRSRQNTILFYKIKLTLKYNSCQTETKISGQFPLLRSTRSSTVVHDHLSKSIDRTTQNLFSFATLFLDTCQNLVSTSSSVVSPTGLDREVKRLLQNQDVQVSLACDAAFSPPHPTLDHHLEEEEGVFTPRR